MIEILVTIAVGALLPLFFTRITYNKYVGLVLALVLLVAVFDGLHRALHIQMSAIIAAAVGFYFSIAVENKLKRK
jgi:general stress protein CsbA